MRLVVLSTWLVVALVVLMSCDATASEDAVYWGAVIGTQLTGSSEPWDLSSVTELEKYTKKKLSVLHWYAPSYDKKDCGGFCNFDHNAFNSARNSGRIPFFSWSTGIVGEGTAMTDAQITEGKYDSYITQFAKDAKAWGHPLFLRFNWEMNGNWFSWCVDYKGKNTAKEFVESWKHVHNIFKKEGAHNVNWVWCPNIDPKNEWAKLDSVYPGDAYVDWTCLDIYNPGNPWSSFESLIESSYHSITSVIAPSKPMIIGEVGCTESGGSKSEWLTDMFEVLPKKFPKIRGLVWFDENDGGSWVIESSTASAAAFAKGIANARYETNIYAKLSGTKIHPPVRKATHNGALSDADSLTNSDQENAKSKPILTTILVATICSAVFIAIVLLIVVGVVLYRRSRNRTSEETYSKMTDTIEQ